MAFHEVNFPLRLSLGVSGGPVRNVDIVTLSNGRESRNARNYFSRRHYDAGSAIRSLADLYAVIDFFEARGGALNGFRFTDPLDHQSAPPGQSISATDQVIGMGAPGKTVFALSKAYGAEPESYRRPIIKPVGESVLVAIDGVPVDPAGFTVDAAKGLVTFLDPPDDGAEVSAGFRFDVPVRFATDRIDITLSAFEAGQIPTIPLIEIIP